MRLILSAKRRPLGMYICGRPGTGKSSLIQNLVLKDIRDGQGVCVIDPTGDLINTLLDWIPEHRVEDTILFDTDWPVPIDFFSYRNQPERQVLADQLLALFELDDAPVSKPRLERIIGTLFDANEKGADCTFLDIERFIDEPSRRHQILGFVPHRASQWPDEQFKKLADYISIIERISRFSESPTLRAIFSDPHPKLNIWDVMQSKKILFINLKDTPTDAFVGSLICAKIQQATFGRREIRDESKRIPFYLYIDECHTIMKYAAPQFEAILTRARKYNLCLTMANQMMKDLPPEIEQKLGMLGAKIFFTDRFKATCWMRGESLRCIDVETPKYLDKSPASHAEDIRKNTLKKYSQSRTIRTGDNAACNSSSTSYERNDDTQPGAAPSHHSAKRQSISYWPNTSVSEPTMSPASSATGIPNEMTSVPSGTRSDSYIKPDS